ncbi:hypothetical protein M8C21_022101 [Ambrosia artemisiifolia]|uniref:PGG domain-containing protein n=1 Tax=Ambrosia artemisiifolia TaxID=4212 RepID=A0AAD5BX55_AMBAR|nr:hypothetical protein M8C21_022101 [Ambrosia artemisiifolia]
MAGPNPLFGKAQYPYPSHVCAQFIVTVKLSGRETLAVWGKQMTCLFESHGMLDFIQSAPDEYIRRYNQSWIRSNELAKAWILATLSPQILEWIVKLDPDLSAKEVWDKLMSTYDPVYHKELRTAAAKAADVKLPAIQLNRIGESSRLPTQEETRLRIEEEEKKKAEKEKNRQQRENDRESLYAAILSEDFNEVKIILNRRVLTLTDDIAINGNSALHVAVSTSYNRGFLKDMFDRALKEDEYSLYSLNSERKNILHVAANIGNTVACKLLVEVNQGLWHEADNENKVPVDSALSNMHAETYHFLLGCYDSNMGSLLGGWRGLDLLLNMISSNDYSNAWRVTHDAKFWLPHPDIVLTAIAKNFPPKLNIWEKKLWLKISEAAKRKEANYIHCKKLLHKMCYQIKHCEGYVPQQGNYNNAVIEATRQNAYKAIRIIVSEFPDAIWSCNEEGHNFIQYAVINRSEQVYNLLYQMRQHKNIYKTIKDNRGNNLLHLAARLAPANKLNPISGAALQIQFELQWFKEVERFVYPICITEKNLFEETPEMIFTREHKELVIEGEKWMKETAQSYTITAALIITIVFAAAITVPGGNKDNGKPMFTNTIAFKIFAVSDAISLFTSLTSLLVFLSILTARYSEQDFLYKLPTKLIIGLGTLFISTTAMLVAFGATLFLVFGENSSLTLVPIAAVTCFPVASFLTLQFPLVYDLIRATYSRNRFGKKSNAPFY